MGKKARLFPSGELKLHTPKKIDKSKQYPIYFYYNWHRNKVTRQTGFYAKIDDWDEKNGKLRRQYGQDYQQVNNQLANRIKPIMRPNTLTNLRYKSYEPFWMIKL